jgi:multiple sugar transport system substrate-binding protein
MKKAVLFLVALLAVLLTAGLALGAVKKKAQNPVKLSFWTMRTTANMMTNLRKQLDDFEKQNPNIKITVEPITYEVVYPRMMTALQSRKLPNVFNCIEGHVAFLQAKNGLITVNGLVNSLGGRKAFITKYLDWASKGKKIYALPDWSLHQGIWYRKDLFAKAGLSIPKSWDELAKAAKTLTQDTDGDGKIDIYGMAIPLARNMVAQQTYSQFLYSSGVFIFDPETGAYAFNKNKDKAVQAMDELVKIYQESSPPGALDWSWPEFRTALVKGQVAMVSEWGAVVAIAQEQNPAMLDKLSVFPFPGPTSKVYPPVGNFGGTYYMAIGKSTPEKVTASKKLVKFLFQKDRLAERANTRPIYALPTMKAAFYSRTYQKNPMVQKYAKELKMLFENVLPYEERSGFEAGLNVVAGKIESSNVMGDAIQNVIVKGWSTIQAVDWLDKQLQAMVNSSK